MRGIVRFLLTKTGPDFCLDASPVQLDPDKPALPISHPRLYAQYLSKLLGTLATLGLAEDTWACNEGVISESDFLNHSYLIFEERRQVFTDVLKTTRRVVVGCILRTTDRVQRMCFAIPPLYQRMDEVVGEALQHVDDKTMLLVLSDYGFCACSKTTISD
jgi:hypothetical protein